MLRHGIDFFRDEIRNGFYIPTAVKQSWAAALDVLWEIDKICAKHGIRYYADWGSFLGAVRHGGFVPWDDDMDICMLREDYVKFRQVCDGELPENYCIHDYERQKNHWLFLARVVNNKHIRFDDEHLLNNYNFPWLSGVDIFLKDYLYDDPVKEKERDDRIMRLLAEAERYIEAGANEGSNREKAIDLYKRAEKIMAEAGEGKRIGQIFPWVLKGAKGEAYESYAKIMRLPFEDTTIPVPSCYNKVLCDHYGDYNVIRKGMAGHDYPAFEGQRKAFEKETGAALPRFSFDKGMLECTKVQRGGETGRREVLFLPIGPREWKSLENTFVKECASPDTDVYVVPLPLMHKDFYGRIQMTDEEILEAEHFEDYVNILNELETTGLNTDNVCLAGFTDYDLSEHCPDRIYIQSPYDNQNPLLTVPEYYYAQNLRMFTNELVYIPLGPVGEFSDNDLPDMLGMRFYVTMPGPIYADKVLVQSENIRRHYVDALTEFSTEGDATDRTGKSENDVENGLRAEKAERAKDTEEMRRYWESKISVEEGLYKKMCDISSDGSDTNGLKRILFGIASYEYYEHKDRFEEALRARLQEFKDNAGRVQAEILIYNGNPDTDEIDIYSRVSGIAAEYGIPVREINSDQAKNKTLSWYAAPFAAYYGSSMPIIHEFIAQKKPVMIADYNI